MTSFVRVASIVVGIDDYEAAAYKRPGFDLRFAAADAEAFHQYARNAWPSGDHALLLDRDATASAIREAFDRIRSSGPHDMLLVYLAGHGEIGADGRGWFCTADARPGTADLDSAELDRLFDAAEGSVTIAFLDCCYAESVVRRSVFFGDLGAARAKLFLCSARHDQLTFEDDAWQHGALSHLLLQALATDSPLRRTEGGVSITGTLFPYLCEQLPLVVFEAKAGARQEPVMGGVSAEAVTLPATATVRRTRDATIFEVVRARYRQVLIGTAAIALVLVILNQFVLYHFAVGPDGFVQVRRGIAPLAWATLPRFTLHLEITIDQTELTTVQPAAVTRLKEGAIWGVWTQKSKTGQRRWAERLAPYLTPPAAERLNLLTGGGVSDRSLKNDRFAGVQWRPDTLADALILGASDTASLQRAYLAQVPSMNDYSCGTPVENRIDFTLLGMSTADVLFYLDSVQTYLTVDSKFAPELLGNAMKLVLYRARHFTGEHAGQEFEAAVKEYRAFVHLLEHASARGWKLPEVSSSNDSWCVSGTLAQILLLSAGSRRDDAVRQLLLAVNPEPTQMGDAFTFPQLAALEALEAAARRGRLPIDASTVILGYLHADDRGLDGYPALVEWLQSIARLQPLPQSIRTELVAELGRPHDKYSFIALRSLGILTRNARFATPAERATLGRYIPTAIESFKGTDELADALGYAGCAGIAAASAQSYLGPRVKDPEVVRPNKQTVLGFEVIQAGDDFAEGVALGRISQTARDQTELERLERFAANRLGVIDPAPIVRALALRRVPDAQGNRLVEIIHRSLAASRTSARRQQLAIEVGVERLLLLPAAVRTECLKEARALWQKEREPDLKMNWATILLRVQRRTATFDPRPCL